MEEVRKIIKNKIKQNRKAQQPEAMAHSITCGMCFEGFTTLQHSATIIVNNGGSELFRHRLDYDQDIL